MSICILMKCSNISNFLPTAICKYIHVVVWYERVENLLRHYLGTNQLVLICSNGGQCLFFSFSSIIGSNI